MLFFTHILLGILIFLGARLFFFDLNWIHFLLTLLGSILPDIDEPHSKLHRWSGIVGKIITFFAKHRGFFHSLLFMALLWGMLWRWGYGGYGFALSLGFFAHLLGDSCTPRGVQVFWPFSRVCFSGPIRTGGLLEFLLSVLLVGILLKGVF